MADPFSAPLTPGEVALVGAGPGAADLLTVAAVHLLADCDVIVHDALASEEVLAVGNVQARRIFAGKRGGRPSTEQKDISATLIAEAKAGRRVVRLKGGDPFLFGRGGEELRALAAAGVRFRVIPGITAGLAAPAVAGIPITDRDVNSTVAFLTGHEAAADSRIDWKALKAAFPVLVLYMAARNLSQVAYHLANAGFGEATPIAVIYAATCADESIHTGTLADACSGLLTADSPSIVVIGDVVARRVPWR